jgi:hypothetical protein
LNHSQVYLPVDQSSLILDFFLAITSMGKTSLSIN